MYSTLMVISDPSLSGTVQVRAEHRDTRYTGDLSRRRRAWRSAGCLLVLEGGDASNCLLCLKGRAKGIRHQA